MTLHTETRKLAAVMFADIEGYTALFQKNESAAINQVQIHRTELEQITKKYHGEIIQFYGDGSVTIFNSVIDAINSSIELQTRSMSQAIPIRIGIHMGDLVYKDNDIFGDVVNVTSRIQSAGIAGSVLVSKKVADELINHPEIKLLPLGKFALKNVGEELDLFAISGSGLKVPPKQKPIRKNTFYSTKTYLILLAIIAVIVLVVVPSLKKSAVANFTTERLGIHPFENLTLNPELDKFSLLTFGWIADELKDIANPGKILQLRAAILYSNGDPTLFNTNPAAMRKTGCIYQIKGSFSPWGLNNDSLEFKATVYDVRTDNAVLQLQKVYCSTSNPWDGIRQMANVIRGYWMGKKDKTLSSPKNDAFEAYTDAILKWGGPTEKEGKQDLIKAIKLDSTFLDAHFLLLDLFYNTGQHVEAHDTLKLIQARFKDLDDRQKNSLRYFEEDISGRRVSAWKFFLNELKMDTLDLLLVTSGTVMANEYLNDPVTVLKLNQYISDDSFDLNTCDYCRTKLLQAMKAHVALKEFEKAGALADRTKLLVTRLGEYTALIHYYMAINDTISTNTILSRIEKDSTRGMIDKYYLNLVAGREAMLQGNIPVRDYYANRAIKACEGLQGRPLARSYYLKDDLDKAISIYEKTWSKETNKGRQTLALGEMGLIYAKKNQTQKANEILVMLERRKERFDYGEIAYLQARIKAHLGETTSAIALLSKSLDEGRLFMTAVTFQYDPDLMILHSEPEYIKLLTRNRQQ